MKTIEDVVREAWAETLAPAKADPALSWEEAGADSLASLRLLMRLEAALGRKLSFDLLDPDMTVHDLAARLAGDAAAAPEAGRAPTLFLVPGIFGDEPILAAFRRWFGARLRFEVVEPPAIDRPAAVHASMARTGDEIAAEIARRQPDGALLLAGFSFGGGAAYEAARALLAGGREIGLLCVLDAPLGRKDIGIVWERHRLAWDCTRSLIRLLARSDAARRLMLAGARRVRPQALVALHRLMMGGLRATAVEQWSPHRLAAPVLLVVNDKTERETLARWSHLLPGAAMVRTPGGHLDLFQPPSMERIGPALLQALPVACRRA